MIYLMTLLISQGNFKPAPVEVQLLVVVIGRGKLRCPFLSVWIYNLPQFYLLLCWCSWESGNELDRRVSAPACHLLGRVSAYWCLTSLSLHITFSHVYPRPKKEMNCEKEIWRFQFAVWPSWACHGPLCFPSPLWIIDEVDDSHVNRQSGPAWTWGQQAAGCHWCWWWWRPAPCWPPPSWPASTRRTAAPCTLVTSQHAHTPTSWPARPREVRHKTEICWIDIF